jgi:hypothetical protein
MTELHAFRPVTTAFEKMRKLLFEPFDIGLWIRLVIIAFFVGSGSGMSSPGNTLQYSMNRADLSNLPSYDFSRMLSDTTLVVLILLLVLALVAIALLFSYLRGVFSFILIDALTTGNVRIVQPFKDNMHRGFKVFLFNIAAAVISLAFIGGIIAIMVLALLWAIGTGGDVSSLSTVGLLAFVLALIFGIIVIVGFSILMGLVIGFFYDFCVPLMYFKGMGLRQAIRSVVGMVKKDPLEFLVYVIVRWVLEMAVALVLFIALLFFFAIFFAIGFVIVLVAVEAAKISILLAAIFGLAILAGLLLLIIVTAVISLPINVYFRYYSLDFLKSMDPSAVVYSGRFS